MCCFVLLVWFGVFCGVGLVGFFACFWVWLLCCVFCGVCGLLPKSFAFSVWLFV